MAEKTINFEEALQVADEAVLASKGRHLTDVEMTILQGSWQNQTYQQMSDSGDYAANYLQRTVGPKLWRLLSEALGEDVSKTNFRMALQRRWRSGQYASQQRLRAPTAKTSKLEFTEGPVALDSPYYVERPPIEERCYGAVLQPGALLRIRAPQQMGKTSLLDRILARSRKSDYQTIALSFDLADSTFFTDLRKFSQWFCASIGKQLGLPNKLEEYWDDIFGCNSNSTAYFEEYLLSEISSPLVLALDKVDVVFEHPAIANDFCRLLRAWYDIAKRSDRRGAIWKKLHLIVAHSTEVYGALDINSSPLANVGIIVPLPEFTLEQVNDLARRHSLDWLGKAELEQLMVAIGGHPGLTQKALSYIQRKKTTLEKLLQIAPTEAGPFGDHLREHLGNLQQYPELMAAFREVLLASGAVKIASDMAFKLQGMGLVQLQGNDSRLRCELYRQYFCDRLKAG
ncbi:MAG: hypothetical protein F6J93_25525 [Oscillatoria sp. SIO1A7]|nr:hypothetical protein [Oscillatoria sp. SIO1A7]